MTVSTSKLAALYRGFVPKKLLDVTAPDDTSLRAREAAAYPYVIDFCCDNGLRWTNIGETVAGLWSG
jgi:hypothetical protein